MTLEFLQNVQVQLEQQLAAVKVVCGAPAGEKPAVPHMNAIEIHGALQLCRQLIQQEQILLSAPPGATGPKI